MMFGLGDQLTISVLSPEYGLTLVTGICVGKGYVKNRPDIYWFQVAGLSTTFYTDECEVKVNG